jgi:hypothetical protein
VPWKDPEKRRAYRQSERGKEAHNRANRRYAERKRKGQKLPPADTAIVVDPSAIEALQNWLR